MVINSLSKCYNKPLTYVARNQSAARVVDWAAEKVAQTADGKDLIRLNKIKKVLPPLIAIWVTGLYIVNVKLSKKIEEERKTPLAINYTIVTAIGLCIGRFLDKSVDKVQEALVGKFRKVNKTVKAERLLTLEKGLKSVVPLFAYTFALRYLAPVVATPLSDKLNKFLIKKGIINNNQQEMD